MGIFTSSVVKKYVTIVNSWGLETGHRKNKWKQNPNPSTTCVVRNGPGHLDDLCHSYQWDLFNPNIYSSELWSTALKFNHGDVSEADGQYSASRFNIIRQSQVSALWKIEDQSTACPTWIMICRYKLTFLRPCQKVFYLMAVIFHLVKNYSNLMLFFEKPI